MSEYRIKVMPFLQKKGNRVAQGSIEFAANQCKCGEIHSGPLVGFQMVGFTICDDKEKGLFVLFPSAKVTYGEENKLYFFLRPATPELLDSLEAAILDVYESMTAPFNAPVVKTIS